MTTLTEQKKQDLKEKLIQMDQEARQTHAEMQVDIRENKGQSSDPIDQADEINERNRLIAKSAHLEKHIRQIAKTLNNFEDYGFCLECGSEINEKRLEAQPASTECIYCKEVQETISKRTA